MLGHQHSGFSVDAGVRIEAHDRAALERVLRYCAGQPLACARLRKERAALVHTPRTHLHRYFGALAPNSPLRCAVTALVLLLMLFQVWLKTSEIQNLAQDLPVVLSGGLTVMWGAQWLKNRCLSNQLCMSRMFSPQWRLAALVAVPRFLQEAAGIEKRLASRLDDKQDENSAEPSSENQ